MDNLTPGTGYHFYCTELSWERLGCDPAVIEENCRRFPDRLIPTDQVLYREPVAVVAYGPSLRDTWQEIGDYKRIITCSGAHKFLVDHGIVPTYHVESDPRAHKAAMLGRVHDATIYLPASICHPTYMDNIAHADVRLWHILFLDKDTYRRVPKGEWLFTGGNTVGPRSIKIARLLGFNKIHLYGFDGSGSHADKHTNAPGADEYRTVRYNGKEYSTTEHLLMHIQMMFNDLHTIPDASFTFHGEGLIQAMAENWQYKFRPGYPLTVVKDD